MLFVCLLLFSGGVSASWSDVFEILKQELKSGQPHSLSGGIGCAGCTIATSLVEQLSVLHNKPVQTVMDDLCRWLPVGVRSTCIYFVAQYGADITRYIEQDKLNPDQVCHGLKLCTNPQCHMYPLHHTRRQRTRAAPARPYPGHPAFKSAARVASNPWAWLEKLIEAVGRHQPEIDFDGDGFSSIPTLRGFNWRGKDCDALNEDVHPGRKVNTGSAGDDYDCNGISGVNPTTNKPWKEELCDGTTHYGIISIGDSAGAHFEIPPSWMNASEINDHTYSDFLYKLSDELDIPHKSGYTGFYNSTSTVPVDSVYLRMREHNRCIHRDYQSLCVNGMRSGAVHKVIETMSRNQAMTHPALVFLELIGNDVCNPHPNFSHMTTVPEFRKNILAALNQLDSILPKGSHVATVGLGDGIELWDNLHNRIHPLGITYETVYNFLNCLEISPCWGWMNSNATVRTMTQKRADQLSAVYSEIIKTHTFKNFDVIYFDFPFKGILAEWKKHGGEAWQLIEPIDGFHPNQIANYLMAGWVWRNLTLTHPHFLGPRNPNNQKIIQMFGDQGGYE